MRYWVFTCLLGMSLVSVFAEETVSLWPQKAPNETTADVGTKVWDKNAFRLTEVTMPQLTISIPEKKTSDTCVLIFPGGAYKTLYYPHMDYAKIFNARGITTAVLTYRVPRRANQPIYRAPLQDAQRAVRFLRANAEKYGIHPEKIGAIGFSAGAHLAIITGTNSQTPTYQPVDAWDSLPCHLNFAVAVYPAYILSDGAEGPNTSRGTDSPILGDFRFEAKTPPMCLIHGDEDHYSSLGSVAIYTELHRRQIPAQLLIFAKASHGLNDRPHVKNWPENVVTWLQAMGF